MNPATDTFVIGKFSQLRLIAWNRDPHDAISGEEALDLYERNWRFIDLYAMEADERALVEFLVREFGQGILHV